MNKRTQLLYICIYNVYQKKKENIDSKTNKHIPCMGIWTSF